MGCSKIDVSLLLEFLLWVTNWTFRTSPSSLLYVFSILAISHLLQVILSHTKTIFPTLKFCLIWFNFSLLKFCKHFFPPLCPKFIWQMLNMLPLLSTVHVSFLESTWQWHDDPCLWNQQLHWTQWNNTVDITNGFTSYSYRINYPFNFHNNVQRNSLLKLLLKFLSIAERILLAG